tara:strand:- start:892 stop:1740 length:849 start_codon:yes stop_codon:yes gene_type:complete
MKRTHTHRGHCQACGRVQAVDTHNNFIAKHGYTVDFGYFSGVCTGSNRKPLEVDKTFTEETIEELSEWIAKKQILLESAVKDESIFSHYSIEKRFNSFDIVPFNLSHVEDEKYTVVVYTEENLRKHCEEYNEKVSYGSFKFDKLFRKFQDLYIKNIQNSISDAQTHIDFLKRLIREVHGKDLINVANAEKILEELEKEALKDFYKTEMKKIKHYVGEPILEVWTNFEMIVEKKTSIGLVGLKFIHSNPAHSEWNRNNYSKQCLLDGKRIAKPKLIQLLQGDL